LFFKCPGSVTISFISSNVTQLPRIEKITDLLTLQGAWNLNSTATDR
jgi:hypothetical protein